MKLLLYYLLIINAAGLLLMLTDKLLAKGNRRRIRERTLFLVAIAGGSVGSLLGMYLFRHKTLHLQFTLGIPLILALQITAFIWVKLL